MTDNPNDPNPCSYIYANCGTWVDQSRYCCYVETEEAPDEGRHYVRVKRYPGNTLLHNYEGFVAL